MGNGGETSLELQWLAHGRYLFKGKDEPMEVFEVGAVGHAPLKAPADSEKARRVVTHERWPYHSRRAGESRTFEQFATRDEVRHRDSL